MNTLLTWIDSHWRIVGVTVGAAVAVAGNLLKPGGLDYLTANAETVVGGAVALGVLVVHFYKHVRNGDSLTDLLDEFDTDLAAVEDKLTQPEATAAVKETP